MHVRAKAQRPERVRIRDEQVDTLRVSDRFDTHSTQIERALLHPRTSASASEGEMAAYVGQRGLRRDALLEANPHAAGDVLDRIDLSKQRTDYAALKREGAALGLLELLEKPSRLFMLARVTAMFAGETQIHRGWVVGLELLRIPEVLVVWASGPGIVSSLVLAPLAVVLGRFLPVILGAHGVGLSPRSGLGTPEREDKQQSGRSEPCTSPASAPPEGNARLHAHSQSAALDRSTLTRWGSLRQHGASPAQPGCAQ